MPKLSALAGFLLCIWGTAAASTNSSTTGPSSTTTSAVSVANVTTTSMETPEYTVPLMSVNPLIRSSALSCYSAISSYRVDNEASTSSALAAGNWYNSTFTETVVYNSTYTFTSYPSIVSTYSLCDGSARADVRPWTTTVSNSSTAYTIASSTVLNPPIPSAPCSLSPTDCRYLYYNTSISIEDDTLNAECGFPAHLFMPCLIGGGPVQLVYFPEPTVEDWFCKGNSTAAPLTSNITYPTTIATMGTTFTSGSVYLSFSTLFATWDGFWDNVGTSFSDFILPLPSSAISSQCGGWFAAQGPGTALNYADLNYPQPASAYKCADRCRTEILSELSSEVPAECNTIWSDFNPMLAVPTEVRDLDPAWATCSFWDEVLGNFWFDPPIALQPAAAVITPTIVPEPTVTTSARPASTPTTQPTATAPLPTVTKSSPATPLQTSGGQGASATALGDEASSSTDSAGTSIGSAASSTASAAALGGIAGAILSVLNGGPVTSSTTGAAQSGIATDVETTFSFAAKSTSGLPSSANLAQKASFVLGSTTYVATAGEKLVMGSVTISVDGVAATINGDVVSLASDGVVVYSQGASLGTTTQPANAGSTSGGVGGSADASVPSSNPQSTVATASATSASSATSSIEAFTGAASRTLGDSRRTSLWLFGALLLGVLEFPYLISPLS